MWVVIRKCGWQLAAYIAVLEMLSLIESIGLCGEHSDTQYTTHTK